MIFLVWLKGRTTRFHDLMKRISWVIMNTYPLFYVLKFRKKKERTKAIKEKGKRKENPEDKTGCLECQFQVCPLPVSQSGAQVSVKLTP